MIEDAREYQGEGWYTFRVWIHTDGRYTVEDWASPEKPEAVWIENFGQWAEGVITEGYPERETIADYYGAGEWPDAFVPVAEGYRGMPGFGEWYRTMANQTC